MKIKHLKTGEIIWMKKVKAHAHHPTATRRLIARQTNKGLQTRMVGDYCNEQDAEWKTKTLLRAKDTLKAWFGEKAAAEYNWKVWDFSSAVELNQ